MRIALVCPYDWQAAGGVLYLVGASFSILFLLYVPLVTLSAYATNAVVLALMTRGQDAGVIALPIKREQQRSVEQVDLCGTAG